MAEGLKKESVTLEVEVPQEAGDDSVLLAGGAEAAAPRGPLTRRASAAGAYRRAAGGRVHEDELDETVYHEVREYIVQSLPQIYKEDIAYVYNYAGLRRRSDRMEWIAVATGALSSILAFLASYFDRKAIALIAGVVGTLALVLSSLANFFAKEAKERARQLNGLLTHFNVREVPDIVVPVEVGAAVNPAAAAAG